MIIIKIIKINYPTNKYKVENTKNLHLAGVNGATSTSLMMGRTVQICLVNWTESSDISSNER